MTLRCSLNDAGLILRSSVFVIFTMLAKVVRGFNESRHRTAMACVPSVRASNIVGIHIENDSFYEHEPDMSWVKGSPGYPEGGTPPLGQSGAPVDLEEHRIREGGGARHSPPSPLLGMSCDDENV